MASFKQYTASGGSSEAFSIPTFSSDEIKVYVDNVLKSAGTHYNITSYTANGGTVTWTSGNVPNGVVVRIVRDTTVTTARATYAAGSSIKADDLNNNQTQALRSLEEQDDQLIQTYDVEDAAITTAKIAADAITGAKIADDQINSEHYVDGSIDTAHIADSQVTTAKIAADAITAAKIADDVINSEHYVAGSIDTEHIADSQITTAKIAADAITNAKIADNSIDSEHYVDGSIDTVHLADNSVTGAKLAAGTIGTSDLADSGVTTAKIAADAVTGAKIADDAIDSEHLAADSIDAEHYAAGSVDTTALGADSVTAAKIADDVINSEHYAAASIDTEHIADGQITTAKIAADAIDGTKIADNAIGAEHIAANAVTTSEIADAELTTLAGMQSGTASILAGGTALTATLAEINTVVDGKSVETTISDTDAAYPTSGAVVDYVAAQIAPIGGLEVIATDAAFPNTQPAAGVVISIADAGGLVVNGSGTSTTGRTVNGSTVTINNIASNFNSTTVDNGVAFMVSSTGSGQIYNYHKATLKEADLLSLSGDINDFAERYRVAGSAPSSSLDEGDLWWDTATDKLKVYDGSSWEEVASSGDFYINTISSYSGTGGNSATFNGSAYRFVLSNPGSSAQQHVVSINGVIQKPNSGTGQPSEGFAINGSTIVFSAAPATGADYFIITVGSTVAIGTPSDNTVSTAKIQNLGVTTDKIAADAVTGAKIADDAIGAEHIEVLDSHLQLADSCNVKIGTGNDFQLYHDGSHSYITNSTGYLHINSATVELKNAANNETTFKATQDGAVELYYDNVKKLETTSYGVYSAGMGQFDDGIKLIDNQVARFGAGNDLQIYHDGSNSIIADTGTGNLQLYTTAFRLMDEAGSENMIKADSDGAVELYYDDTLKFGTDSAGVYARGDLMLNYADNYKIKLGAGNDLQLYHDGSNSYVRDDGEGDLILKGSEVRIQSGNSTDTKALFKNDGAVELYNDNVKTFETQANGITVLGPEGGDAEVRLKADEGDDYEDLWRVLAATDGSFHIQNVASGSWEHTIRAVGNGAVELYYNHSKKLETRTNGIHVAGEVRLNDNNKFIAGTGDDLQIYFDGTNSYIKEPNAVAGQLVIDGYNGTDIRQGSTGEHMIRAIGGGAVELYYDNSKKIETGSGGISVTGGINLTTNLSLLDNGIAKFGTGDDLQIYHDGSNSYLTNSTGALILQTDNLQIKNAAGNESLIRATADGNAELYYDNSKKFQTESDGVRILGDSKIWFDAWQGRFDRNWDDYPSITITPSTTYGNQGEFRVHGQSGSLGGYGSGADFSIVMRVDGGYEEGSDRRRKTNIEEITGALATVKQLTGKKFNIINRQGQLDPIKGTKKQFGLIAQECKDIIPEVVNFHPDEDTPNENGWCSAYGLSYGNLTPLLINAIKELSAEVETLKNKVAALEAK